MEDENAIENYLFYSTLIVEPNLSTPQIYNFTHQQMLNIANHKEASKHVFGFQRFLEHKGKAVPLDNDACYLGKAIPLNKLREDNYSFYINLLTQKNNNKEYQNYAVCLKNGDLFLPEDPCKVFDDNLYICSNMSVDKDYEFTIYEYFRAEIEMLQSSKDINKADRTFLKRMAKLISPIPNRN